MYHVRLQFTLTLVGPVLTRATMAGAVGLDALTARDSRGRPYLPYSLVRGKLRETLEELAAALAAASNSASSLSPPLDDLFGPRREDTIAGGRRGCLRFTDFLHHTARSTGTVRPRIRMNPETGTADKAMLLTQESLFTAGERAEFEGEVVFISTELQRVKQIQDILLAGFRWMAQLGAERTTGFGRMDSVALTGVNVCELAPAGEPDEGLQDREIVEASALAAPQLASVMLRRPGRRRLRPAPDHRYGLRIRPRGPICIAKRRMQSNVFESEEFISGSALLGALATTWREAAGLPLDSNQVVPKSGSPWLELEKHFSLLRVTHAFPSPVGSGRRPYRLPLSLVAQEPTPDETSTDLFDVALVREPGLVGQRGRPPVFQVAWKHDVWQAAARVSGWPDVSKELRVRTAIDEVYRRAAQERLFAYEMVLPDRLEWLGFLDLSRVPSAERDAVMLQLHALLAAGLGPLGKTKVDADIEIVAADEIQPAIRSSLRPVNGRYWVLTLQTPAVLCRAEDLRPPSGAETEATAASKLRAGYERVWRELSGGRLRLVNLFARQSLAGGYVATRFRTADRYAPFILTDAGSSFVLEAVSSIDEARRQVRDWHLHGLPAPESCQGYSGSSGVDAAAGRWDRCPYLPSNGYGEVTVNPPWFFEHVHDWPLVLPEATRGRSAV